MIRTQLLRTVLAVVGLLLVATSAPAAAVAVDERFDTVRPGQLPAGWSAVSGDWQVDSGRLVGSSASGVARILLPAGDRDGFAFEATVAFLAVADPMRWLALQFDARDGDDASAVVYHQVVLRQRSTDRSGVEYAAQLAGGRWDVRERGSASAVTDLGKARRLRVEKIGQRVRFFVDGSLVIDHALAIDATGGRLGLGLSGARVAFDDVRVTALDAALEATLRVDLGPVRRVPIIAHRGASAEAPENTLVAVHLAIEQKSDGVEFDVYRTKDGELVLFHDRTLERTTDFRAVFPGRKDASVAGATLAELRKLDAGAWKAAKYRGEPIPTLAEALAALAGRSTPVVEIKPGDIGRDVAAVVRESGSASEVFVQSFSDRAIREFREVLPEVTTGWLTGDRVSVDPIVRARRHLATARRAGASAIVCSHRVVHPDYVREIHRHAMSVWVYTVDDLAMAEALVRLGIDGIITNVPATMLALVGTPPPESDRTRGDDAVGSRIDPRPAGDRQRMDLVRGSVQVVDLLRFVADRTGLTVIPVGDLRRREIRVVDDVENVDVAVVQAYLEANGIRLFRRRIAAGQDVIEVRAGGASTDAGSEVRAKPIILIGPRGGDGKAKIQVLRDRRARKAPAAEERVRRAKPRQ